MSNRNMKYRFYDDLAVWWPLISPPEEYEDEANYAASVLRSATIAVREVLELGSGGGHNAVHLKTNFAMTLIDLSGSMLDMSMRLNPECHHQRDDMRTVRLGRSFDAVFVHDAVDYMVTEADLRQVIETAFVHCRPGGVAVFVPDRARETFEEETGHGGSDDAQSAGAVVVSVLLSSRSDMTPRANIIISLPPGKRPGRKSKAMTKTSKKKRTADEVAEMASRGEDISSYFTNKFTVVRPARRVNVDLTHGMLRDLDEQAARLNISRQAVIKTLLGRALKEERENRPRPKKAG